MAHYLITYEKGIFVSAEEATKSGKFDVSYNHDNGIVTSANIKAFSEEEAREKAINLADDVARRNKQ